jgi:hypothetical protein
MKALMKKRRNEIIKNYLLLMKAYSRTFIGGHDDGYKADLDNISNLSKSNSDPNLHHS